MQIFLLPYVLAALISLCIANDKRCRPELPCCNQESSSDCPSDDCVTDVITCSPVVIADYDFYHSAPILIGPSPNWLYYPFDSYTPNDGTLTMTKCGGILNSKPFAKWKYNNAVREFDNFKYWIINQDAIEVPAGGKLEISWTASTQTFGVDQSQFPESILQGDNDLRLGAGFFAAFDSTTGMFFGFALTNDRIYALYQRLPWARVVGSEYAAFMYAIPIAERKPTDLHNMLLVLSGKKQTVTWKLEGKRKFQISKSGYKLRATISPIIDLGGIEMPAFPATIQYSFGTATWVNAYPAPIEVCRGATIRCPYPKIRTALTNTGLVSDPDPPTVEYNPIIGAPTLASYYDPVGSQQLDHIWGQGVMTEIKRLRVVSSACC